MKQFTRGTQKIIDAHKADFDCTNWKDKLKSYGGYNAYLKKLGGIFAKWNGKTGSAKTTMDFREIAEYTWGLMSIYGFDYNNGKIYRKWGGGKPFYTSGKKGRSNWGRIDDLCGKDSKDKTTNCNYAQDSFLYKAGLFGKTGQPTNSCGFRSHIKSRKFKFFHDLKDLQVGDLVNFFSEPATGDDCNKWKTWHHVAIVGEIINGHIIMYDGGGRFITTGRYKHELKVDSKNRPIGDYSSYKGYIGIRALNLKDAKHDMVRDRTDECIAVGVIHDDYGKNQERKTFLGSRYDAVQKLVTHYKSTAGRADYIRACADFVLSGYAGSGVYRQSYFGDEYAEVQKKVEWVTKAAEDVWSDKYGSNDAREKALGEDYWVVQRHVDRTKDAHNLGGK